jgi:pyridoxamine 5'-phosphate oxidase
MDVTQPTAGEELNALEARLWAELATAARTRGHAWRTPVLATVGGPAGCDARVVVLREVDTTTREIACYTDARSPKAAQVAAHPQAVLVMWSAELGWQLRLTVALTLETTGLAVASRWAKLRTTSAAQDYLAPRAPGADLGSTGQHASREHFALITAQVRTMDWLSLDPAGHRRAVFDGDGARWIQP